jgi:mono/diheme cytochrome c family protein
LKIIDESADGVNRRDGDAQPANAVPHRVDAGRQLRQDDRAGSLRTFFASGFGIHNYADRPGSAMQTKFIVAAVLLATGFAVMALSNPGVQPPVAPAEEETQADRADAAAQRIDPEARPRGQLLYENHCMVCHESVVHIRSKQSARSLEDLHARVVDWARYMKLPWSEEEVSDVTRFLESRYYKFESRP